MGTVWVIVVVVVAWVAVGLLATLWLARHGHRDPVWFLVGPLLGLAFVPIALERAERLPRRLSRTEAESEGAGRLRVLVALDGSADAEAAFVDAVRMLGPQVRSFVLAEVVDYDAASASGADGVTAAQNRLSTTAATVPGRLTSCEILTGPPADALLVFAARERVDAIVVGKHGRGRSVRLSGNVAEALVRHAPLPVLVGGRSAVG